MCWTQFRWLCAGDCSDGGQGAAICQWAENILSLFWGQSHTEDNLLWWKFISKEVTLPVVSVPVLVWITSPLCLGPLLSGIYFAHQPLNLAHAHLSNRLGLQASQVLQQRTKRHLGDDR